MARVWGQEQRGQERTGRWACMSLPLQAAAPHIMAHRHPYTMAAALLPRVGRGTPTTPTHLLGEGQVLRHRVQGLGHVDWYVVAPGGRGFWGRTQRPGQE